MPRRTKHQTHQPEPRQGTRKLSEQSASEIKVHIQNRTMSKSALGRLYGVRKETIDDIHSETTWRHVEPRLTNKPLRTRTTAKPPAPIWVTLPHDARPVPGFASYLVSRSGVVFSRRRHRTDGQVRQLRPSLSSLGYLHVSLATDNSPGDKRRGVHQIVAITFLGAPGPDQFVRHLDGDPTNNRMENLAWGNMKENAADRDRHGRTRRGEDSSQAGLANEQVLEIKNRLLAAESCASIASSLGVGVSAVEDIKRGRTWKSVGPRIPEKRRIILRERPHPNARLDQLTVSNIRGAAARGASHRSLAEKYGVSVQTIGMIVRGQSWTRVPTAIELPTVKT